MKLNFSLQNKIFFIFITVIIFSISLIGWFGYKSASDSYIKYANDKSADTTTSIHIESEEKLKKLPKITNYFTNFYALKQYMIWESLSVDIKAKKYKQTFSNSLIDFLNTQKEYYEVRVIDLDGNEIISIVYDEKTDTTRIVPDRELQNKKK